MSKKKDKIIDKLVDRVSDLEQEIHERELDRRKFLCILEDMDDFFTRNLIPKLFINKEASKRYAFMKPIQGYEELAEETYFMKTWVIDDKQHRPPHERVRYTRINKYPERGSYKWGDK
jgi:hypothetical protein